MKLKKNEDESALLLLRIGNKTPMEGVTETKFGAEMEGPSRDYPTLPHPGTPPNPDTTAYARKILLTGP